MSRLAKEWVGEAGKGRVALPFSNWARPRSYCFHDARVSISSFFVKDEERQRILTSVKFTEASQGAFRVAHGGCTAMVLDALASIARSLFSNGSPKKRTLIAVKFRNLAPIEKEMIVEAFQDRARILSPLVDLNQTNFAKEFVIAEAEFEYKGLTRPTIPRRLLLLGDEEQWGFSRMEMESERLLELILKPTKDEWVHVRIPPEGQWRKFEFPPDSVPAKIEGKMYKHKKRNEFLGLVLFGPSARPDTFDTDEIIHGGAIFAVLDQLCGRHVRSLASQQRPVTANLTTKLRDDIEQSKFLRQNGTLLCIASSSGVFEKTKDLRKSVKMEATLEAVLAVSNTDFEFKELASAQGVFAIVEKNHQPQGKL